ncbi:hypothetical protein FACS1894124_4770 [Spirochaetia bacterium]|nr:hypothetical protein FACS1894124_4770 [Spirochaetia bacterium]
MSGRIPVMAGVILGLTLAACSSAPKRPAEILTLRNYAVTQLNLANREADRGNYAAALDLLMEARKQAVISDDPALLVRTGLAQGNILSGLDREDEADAARQEALAEAERIANTELAAICRIYMMRAQLLKVIAGTGAGSPAELRTQVTAELGAVKTDRQAEALGWTVVALAEKELRRWTEAEAALKRALAIHDKERYLEQAAYDWYLIASVRSVAARYDDAASALESAIAYDRRAENGYGLGTDWLALGDVYAKAGRKDKADAAYRRSAEIFRAAGFGDLAAQAIRRRE